MDTQTDTQTAVCAQCGSSLLRKRLRAKYCNSRCQRAAYVARWRANNPGAGVRPTGTTGTMHEMLVIVDLLRRGFYVYKSVTPNSPCDLAIANEKQFLRVEVTTGVRGVTGTLSVIKKSERYTFDILAIVEHGGLITYRPAFDA